MITGQTLRDAILSGANNIANQRTRVDELNVFPVPDGDTGTNMSMTIGAARAELEAMPDSCTVAEASKTAASAMLRGARGNSGVITSLLFRGFSKALKDKTEASSADLAAALQQGVEAAYKAVMKPTEGTILTVSRLAAEKAAECTELDVPAMWDATLQAGQAALDDTPNLLPVLKKAGVVDAGGQGIMLIFEGMKQVFDGGEIIAGAEVAAKPKVSSEAAGKGVFADDLMKVEDIKNGYCTQFLINKYEGASAAKMRAFAESNGDSVVCIEDDDVINLHVHTADPGKILSEAIKYGYLTNFKIENMHEQFLARQKQGKSLEKQASAEKAPSQSSEFVYAAVDPSRDYGFVAVAAGDRGEGGLGTVGPGDGRLGRGGRRSRSVIGGRGGTVGGAARRAGAEQPQQHLGRQAVATAHPDDRAEVGGVPIDVDVAAEHGGIEVGPERVDVVEQEMLELRAVAQEVAEHAVA